MFYVNGKNVLGKCIRIQLHVYNEKVLNYAICKPSVQQFLLATIRTV